ncbi:MAG: hypothetical protein JWN04_5019 [Myxococcaceae bacterium]|nr:hypothetical protein [Myxococcaceae bacterium]
MPGSRLNQHQTTALETTEPEPRCRWRTYRRPLLATSARAACVLGCAASSWSPSWLCALVFILFLVVSEKEWALARRASADESQ